MPASTEKKRNSGVRKAATVGLTAHGDAERHGRCDPDQRAQADTQEARADMGEQRAVADRVKRGRADRTDRPPTRAD
jgi:hypothetical protein